MKKGWKKGLIGISGVLCLGLAVAGAACVKTQTLSEPTEENTQCTGVVHFLERGEPSDVLGECGDVCMVATTGEFFRKTQTGWTYEELFDYNIEGEVLTVSYRDGSAGTYTLAATAEGDHVHTYGDAYIVYAPKCIIPGIGVEYCTECHEASPVILAAVPENHDIDEDNYGKCIHCGKLNDGTSGFEVKKSEQLTEVFEQVEDGDTVKLAENATLAADDRLIVGGEGEDKDITLDVAGKKFTSKVNEQSIVGEDQRTNIVVEEGSKLTITDTSTDHDGTFDVDMRKFRDQDYNPQGDGHYGLKVDGGELEVTDITFNITNKTGGFATVVSNGGSVKFDNTVINMTGKTTDLSSPTDYDNGYGMYVTNGSTIELSGVTLNAEGDIAPFRVGPGAEESTINLSNGSTFTMKNCYNDIDGGSFAAGFVIYPGGTVNVENGCRVQLIGESINPNYKDQQREYSTAVGFVCIGGGKVNFHGSMYLGMTYGMAIGFRTMVLGAVDSATGNNGLTLDANIVIDDGATIQAEELGSGGFHIFEVQISGTQYYTGSLNFLEPVWVKPSVTIQPTASIRINNVECFDWTLSKMATNEQKEGTDNFRLDFYDRNGIQDNRTQPTD